MHFVSPAHFERQTLEKTNMKQVQSRIIRFDEKMVTVKMMDNTWIINRCVSEAPFIPKRVVVWSHADRCGRLLIPGDKYEQIMYYFMNTYGNAAVIAWDGNLALGHMVFVPKIEARKRQMLFHERMSESPNDDKTFVVHAVGFCSIGGQEYRGRGIGRTMAEMVIEWATVNEWHAIQIFGVPSGLFPSDWMDACIPPKVFWEKLRFKVMGKTRIEQTWEEVRARILADNPRNNKSEMDLKRKIIAKVEQGQISEDEWAYLFDLEKNLKLG